MFSEPAALERNLQLFLRYKAATSVSPWLPVFFLYFIERLPLGEAVLPGSANYFSVFLLNVKQRIMLGRSSVTIEDALVGLIYST